MRLTKIEVLLFAVLALGPGWWLLEVAFAWTGFLGVGIVGLMAACGTVRADLEKECGAGDPQTSSALHLRSHADMDGGQRAAHRAETASWSTPLLLARLLSAALIVFGFGGFYLFQLDRCTVLELCTAALHLIRLL